MKKVVIMFQAGDILDHTYRLLEEIGAGGTGIIYKAYHLRLRKYVVVKKIKDNFIGSINQRAEVDILKGLHHTYLPQVYDFLQIDHQVFTVMDYVEGLDLEHYVNAGYRYSEKNLILWMYQLLEVLKYLHSQVPPILHSDIKPANIMITKEGNVCLIDFNISLNGSEEQGIQGVSVPFAAPEQLLKMNLAAKKMNHSRIRLDARCDIYSLGMTLIYLVNHSEHTCSEGMEHILRKATQEDREKRYTSAEKMKHALDHIKKEDTHYIRYRNISIAGHACLIGIAILASLSMYFGYHTMKKEEFNKEIKQLEYYNENYMSDLLIDSGVRILNTKSYRTEMKKQHAAKAWILHAVGDGYFWNENYAEAAEYYEESIADAKGTDLEAAYVRDCAIARSRNGEMKEAGYILKEAEEAGLDDSGVNLIRGEVALAEERYEEAAEILKEVGTTAEEAEVKARAMFQLAQIYKGYDNKKLYVQYLEEAYSISKESVLLRQLGEAYNDSKLYRKALTCYEALYKEEQPTFEDQVNYALSLELLESYREAKQVLLRLTSEYSNDYRLYMYLTRITVKAAEQESKKPDYTEAEQYYKKAKQSYQLLLQEGKRDEQMEQIERYMEDIK